MTFRAIRALHACIGSAIDELEHIYKQSGTPPSDFPAMDDPIFSQATAEQLVNDPAALVPIRHIVAACAQLSATGNRPFDSIIDAVLGVRTLSMHLCHSTQ